MRFGLNSEAPLKLPHEASYCSSETSFFTCEQIALSLEVLITTALARFHSHEVLRHNHILRRSRVLSWPFTTNTWTNMGSPGLAY